MLNPFPDLLVYGFFAPTLLRLGAAVIFLYMAYLVYQHRTQASHQDLPVIGAQPWAAGFVTFVYAAIGALLLVGYYTQIAAILGAIAALKELVWGKRMGVLFPLPRLTAFLLLMLCLSLLLSGAGALALDLPL